MKLSWISWSLYICNRLTSLVISPLYLVENIFYVIIIFCSLFDKKLNCCKQDTREGSKLLDVNDFYLKKKMFYCLKVDMVPSVGLYGNIITLGVLLFFYWHTWADLYNVKSDFHKFCEWIHDTFDFNVDYSDIALLVFVIFRLVLLIIERVYEIHYYCHFAKNWNVRIDETNCEKNMSFCSIAFCGGKMIDYNKVLKEVQWNDRAFNREHDVEIDLVEDELRSSYTFDPFLLSLFGLKELWKDYRRKCWWSVYRKMTCNMHKTLLCVVLAITVSLIVNWYEESDMEVQSMSEDSCSREGEFCLALNNTFGKNYDECACGKVSHRRPVILVTVIFASCIGFYLTYREILSFIFRHWLRFQVLPAVWVLVDPTTLALGSAGRQNLLSLNKTWDKAENDIKEVEEGSDSESVKNVPVDSKKDECKPLEPESVKNLPLDKNKDKSKPLALNIGESSAAKEKSDNWYRWCCTWYRWCRKDTSSSSISEEKFTSEMTLDERAFVDSALLIAGNKDQVTDLRCEVEEKLLSGNYHSTDRSIMEHEILEKLIKRKYGEDVKFEDVSRKVRNLLNFGTTMLTLEEQKEESLLLIVRGSWTGGAFEATHPHLKGIKFAATQHFVMSFSKGKSLITQAHDFNSNRKVNKQEVQKGSPEKSVSFRRAK